MVQRCSISGNMTCLGRFFLSPTKVGGKNKGKKAKQHTPRKRKTKPPFTSFSATQEPHCIFYLELVQIYPFYIDINMLLTDAVVCIQTYVTFLGRRKITNKCALQQTVHAVCSLARYLYNSKAVKYWSWSWARAQMLYLNYLEVWGGCWR